MYKPTQERELSREQLETARRVFRGKLLKLRYPPQFMARNCDELLAMGQADYVRALDRGIEVDEPSAFIVHASWQRMQNMLHAEDYRPRMVSADAVLKQADSQAPSAQELLETADRARRVREAVAKLSEDQRKVLALTFFEDFSIREAARHLGWSAGKVQHHHRTALEHMRRLLPVRSSDELTADLGAAAWLSLAGGASTFPLPAGSEAILEKTGHGASGLWARAQDLGRRVSLGGGGDAASAVASSGGGRAAGACAGGLVIACTAALSGAIPGVGPAVFGGSDHDPAHAARPAVSWAAEPAPRSAQTRAPQAERRSASATTNSAATDSTSSAIGRSDHKAELRRVRETTQGVVQAASDSQPEVGSATASDEGSGSEVVTVHPESSDGKLARSGQKQIGGEFQPSLHP